MPAVAAPVRVDSDQPERALPQVAAMRAAHGTAVASRTASLPSRTHQQNTMASHSSESTPTSLPLNGKLGRKSIGPVLHFLRSEASQPVPLGISNRRSQISKWQV